MKHDKDQFEILGENLQSMNLALDAAATFQIDLTEQLRTAALLVAGSEGRRKAASSAQHFSNRSTEEYEIRLATAKGVAELATYFAAQVLTADQELATELRPGS